MVDYYRTRNQRQLMSLDATVQHTDAEDSPLRRAEKGMTAEHLQQTIGVLNYEAAVAAVMDKAHNAVRALQYRAVHNLCKALEIKSMESAESQA